MSKTTVQNRTSPEYRIKNAAWQRAWRIKNREHFRLRERARAYKKKYGITPEQAQEILTSQGNKCAICGLVELYDILGKRRYGLHVDHNHKTGKVRGLLCNGCNRALGFFNEDIDKMLKAIEYLKKHEHP